MKCPYCPYEWDGESPAKNIAEHIRIWHPLLTEEEKLAKIKRYPLHWLKEKGFARELALVKQGRCPVCANTVREEELVGSGEWKEWQISGLCGSCQRKRKEGKL